MSLPHGGLPAAAAATSHCASVRASFNANQAIQAVAVCDSPLSSGFGGDYQKRIVALGCGSHVELLKLDAAKGISQQCVLHWKNAGRFTVTDVAFCPLDAGLVSASATNGSVAVFEFDSQSSAKGGRVKWDSGESARSVSRVAWSPSDCNVLASASMDGTVRLFDMRRRVLPGGVGGGETASCDAFKLRTDAIRDVQFDPFDATRFAALCDAGTLSLWDTRNSSTPVHRNPAHTLSGLCIAWHGSRRGIIATGSRDKTVKIWDVSSESQDGSTGAVSDIPNEDWQARRPMHVLHTPSAVGRVRWRVNSEQQASRGWALLPGMRQQMQEQLATTSSAEGGEISVWRLGAAGMPACVLSGHQETCTDFQWLDTPGRENESCALSSSSSAANVASSDSGTCRRDCSLGVFQHILSVGKDGRMLIQDVRCGYYFAQHMARCTTTISSRGHVAFSRGFVPRQDKLALAVTAETAAVPGFLADAPELFGYPAVSVISHPSPKSASALSPVLDDPRTGARQASPRSDSTSSSSTTTATGLIVASSDGQAASQKGSKKKKKTGGAFTGGDTGAPSVKIDVGVLPITPPVMDSILNALTESAEGFETGAVFCGLADFSNLQDARVARAERGAEGGVFDPAVISLLARSYVLGRRRSREDARQACEINHKIAADAGLSSRAAIWAATLALLRVLPSQGTLNSPTLSSSALSHGNLAAPLTVSTVGSASSSVYFGASQQSTLPSFGSLAASSSDTWAGGVAPPLRGQLPAEVPFGAELLGSLLLELLEGGDTQHFVCLCEVLRRADLVDQACASVRIGDMRRREAYLAYFDLLSRLQLFCAANSIVKNSDEEYISKLSRQGVAMHTVCAKCGKEIPEHGSHPWCAKCSRCATLCALCHRPVKGLMQWCPVCGHGGHLKCISLWFLTKGMQTCPSGCGHNCCPSPPTV